VLLKNLPKRAFSENTSEPNDLHNEEARWFAVQVGHRKEKVVAKALDRAGIAYFLPLRHRPYRYESKTGVRMLPLLPGYIFVKIIPRQAVAVQRITFVFRFVETGRERRPVKQHEIDLLRRLSTDDSLEWVAQDKLLTLQAGSLVEICRGPLAGVRGHYLHAKDKNTFVITFGALDTYLTTCEVSPRDVIPLQSEVSTGAIRGAAR
jgi:transcription antitermination factor NusG